MPLNPLRDLYVYFDDPDEPNEPVVYRGSFGWSWEYASYGLVIRDADRNRETYPWHIIATVSDRRVLATLGAEADDGGTDPS